MKKLILFLVVASLSMLGTACSSDDNKDSGKKEMQLMSDADEDGVMQGASVEFTVLVEEGGDVVEMESGVTFYVDGKEISNPHTFDKVGTFTVVAKKKGYKDSNALTIKVVEGHNPGGGKKGKLSLDVIGGVREVEVGDEVRFAVTDEEGISITNAEIALSDGTSIGYNWIPRTVGTYKFIASAYEYSSSDGLIITVKEKKQKKIVLALESNPSELYINENFELSVKDGEGAAISNATLYKNNVSTGVTSVNGRIQTKIETEGTYTLKVVQEGVESNTVSVTIKKKTVVPNSFTFAGQTYNISTSYLFFLGIDVLEDHNDSYVAVWQLEARDSRGLTAGIVFYTPATLLNPSTGDVSYERPTTGNTIPLVLGIAQNNVMQASTYDAIAFVFDARLTGSLFAGRYDASAPNLGRSPFSMNFNGVTNYVDQSGAQAVQGVSASGQADSKVRAKMSQVKRLDKEFKILSR